MQNRFTPKIRLLVLKYSFLKFQCYVVKPVQEVPEKAYLEDLMSEIIELAKLGRHSWLPCIPEKEPNLATPTKEEVLQFQRTRFPVNSSQILNYRTGIWQPQKLIYLVPTISAGQTFAGTKFPVNARRNYIRRNLRPRRKLFLLIFCPGEILFTKI